LNPPEDAVSLLGRDAFELTLSLSEHYVPALYELFDIGGKNNDEGRREE
jgi:hypothetical protein